jgi:hypothetical protein
MAKDDADAFEQIAKIGNEMMSALAADTVVVNLKDGKKITGAITGFKVSKKPATKGKKAKPASGRGSVSIQIEPGTLEIDCLTIESIAPVPG